MGNNHPTTKNFPVVKGTVDGHSVQAIFEQTLDPQREKKHPCGAGPGARK